MMPEAIKILFLSADPNNQKPLRLSEEAREIREKIRLAKEREAFSYEDRWGVRIPDLTQAMLDIKPTITHFSGHGAGTGGLCFENPQGQSQLVSAKALSALFARFTKTLRCVVLNACYSEEQAKAIVQHVDYVVGMKDVVDDRAAIAFAVGFYQAVGAGETVEEAFEFGKTQILLQGLPDEEVPVLHVRDGVEANKAFITSESSTRTPDAANKPHSSETVEATSDRTLITFLEGLTPADLSRLLVRIPGAEQQVTQNAPHLQRVAELLGYTRSVNGPGIKRLTEIVTTTFPTTPPFV